MFDNSALFTISDLAQMRSIKETRAGLMRYDRGVAIVVSTSPRLDVIGSD
jgi:hypothetical protein